MLSQQAAQSLTIMESDSSGFVVYGYPAGFKPVQLMMPFILLSMPLVQRCILSSQQM